MFGRLDGIRSCARQGLPTAAGRSMPGRPWTAASSMAGFASISESGPARSTSARVSQVGVAVVRLLGAMSTDMTGSDSVFERFFRNYAQASMEAPATLLPPFYAESFIVGSPSGSATFKNDEKFVQ